jgi:pimeloyl-ACP methyl ester carboxylesterase
MPVLILWAEKERVLPFPDRLLKWLRKRLPDAEVVSVPRTGHMLLEESPEAANAAIRRFLGEAAKVQEAPVRASRG